MDSSQEDMMFPCASVSSKRVNMERGLYEGGREGVSYRSWSHHECWTLWRRMSHGGSSVGHPSSSEPATLRNHHLLSLLSVRHSCSGWTLHDPLQAACYGHGASRGAKVIFWLGFTSKNFALQDQKEHCDIYMTSPRSPHDHGLLQASQRAHKTFQTVPTHHHPSLPRPPNTTTTTVTDCLERWSFQQTL